MKTMQRKIALFLAIVLCLSLFTIPATAEELEVNHALMWNDRQRSDNIHVAWDDKAQELSVTYVDAFNFFALDEIDEAQDTTLWKADANGEYKIVPGVTTKIVRTDNQTTGNTYGSAEGNNFRTVVIKFFSGSEAHILEADGDYAVFFDICANGYHHKSMVDVPFKFTNTKSEQSGEQSGEGGGENTGPLTSSRDRYSFANEQKEFGRVCTNPDGCSNCAVCPRYRVSDADFERLIGHVKRMYGEAEANTVKNSLQEYRNRAWSGSCFGLSATAILDKRGALDMKGLASPAAGSLWELPRPAENAAVASAINYYQMAQLIPAIREGFEVPYSSGQSLAQRLEGLVARAKAGETMQLGFQIAGWGGHAVVVIGYEAGAGGSHRVLLYDNNHPGSDTVMSISSDYRTCHVEPYRTAGAVANIRYTSDFGIYEGIKIGGAAGAAKPAKPLANTQLTLRADQSTTVTNAEGQKLSYNGKTGEVTGTMPVLSVSYTEAGASMAVIEVPHSETFTFEATGGGGLDVTVVNAGMYASASSSQASQVTMGKANGVTVSGSGKVGFSMSLGLNSEVCELVLLSGQTSQGGASLWQGARGAVAKGEFTKSTRLTVFNEVTQVNEHIFTTNHGEVLITRVNGRIDVLGSSRGDGVYDVSVLGGEGTMANFERTGSYRSGQFADVDENAWYGFNGSKSVADAYEYGLMKGSSATTFRPNGTLTLAEAIAVAVRVHRIYSTGSGSVAAEAVWWQPYVDYVIANEIIEAGDFGGNYERAATRAEMAYIFAQALPAGEFVSQNTVNGLPDVKSGAKYFAEIMTLYRAGVITGSDSAGTFKPNANITRAEAAAIISRVVLPGARVKGRTYG